MSIYLILPISLAFVSIAYEAKGATLRIQKRTFNFFWLILTIVLALRYGQGTDYFGYKYIYMLAPLNIYGIPHYLLDESIHSEMGYKLLCAIFRVLNIDFCVFVLLVSILEMILFMRFARKFDIQKPVTLLFMFPTLYCTYFMSAIRQGIVIAFFLGVLLPLYQKNKKKTFILLTLILATIHIVALSCLIVFFARPIRKIVKKQQLLTLFGILVIAWIMGIVLSTSTGSMLLRLPGITNYVSTVGFNIGSVVERWFYIVVISKLYFKLKNKQEIEAYYYMYMFSMILYGLFFEYPLISSRFAGTVRFVEIYLLVYLIKKYVKSDRIVLVALFAFIAVFMTVKNVNSYIKDGSYYDNTNVINYPYVSVFNQTDISKYRDIKYRDIRGT